MEWEWGKDSTEAKKLFRERALKHHPDCGGDPETYMRLRHEFERVANDPRRFVREKQLRYYRCVDSGTEHNISLPIDGMAGCEVFIITPNGQEFRLHNVGTKERELIARIQGMTFYCKFIDESDIRCVFAE